MPTIHILSKVDLKEEAKSDHMEVEKQSLTLAAASALTSLSHSPSPFETAAQNKYNEDSDSDEEIPVTFPQRLMEILSNGTLSEIISWLPHGKAFIVYQKKKFANEVLPRYFKQSKYTSFTRKLNRWGFVRVTRGPETGAYYHNYFQRGDMKLCMQMTCQTDRSSRNNKLQGIKYNALSAIPPTSSGPSAYVPPPAYPKETLQALDLARKVHDNNLKVKQLAAAASLQKSLLLRASQRTQKPVLSDNPAMYPHSEYSVSIVRAAIEVLNRSKFPGSLTAISSQFVSLANAASASGFTRKTVPKAIHRSPAA